MAKKVIVAYIPAIHQGYRRLFEAYPAYRILYLLGKDVTAQFRELQKEIRALDPTLASRALKAWRLFDEVRVVSMVDLEKMQARDIEVLMPDDDVSHVLAPQYFNGKQITFSPVFLRWDRRRSEASNIVDPDAIISEDELAKKMLASAHEEGLKSSNIWRRVGAVLAKDGKTIIASSAKHRPTEYSAWIDGDVRANFKKGVGIDISTSQHAESCAIAEAARQGLALEGADLYVNTFPCPACAMLIAYSGVKRLYYAEGYAVLDGLRVLRAQGVEIYNVAMPALTDGDEAGYVAYPSTDS